ncbi:MAG: DUF3168 domain-containing protein [Parasphingorhabdus sp.]|nr:DUF3168 domain-containing protein [Parasphingorhabdus sp.]
MSALADVQSALLITLRGNTAFSAAVSGIYDGPPPRASYPYVALATGSALDFSHKTGRGRELSLALSIYDDGISAQRLIGLMGQAEDILDGGIADPPDWQIVTCNFQRARVLRNAGAPWAGLLEYRFKVLEI